MAKIRYKIHPNGKVDTIHKVVVHRFKMGDVEDPEIYAAAPIWDWQQTEAGSWVMKNAIEAPYWLQEHDFSNYSYNYIIVAELEEKKLTEYYLKFGKVT